MVARGKGRREAKRLGTGPYLREVYRFNPLPAEMLEKVFLAVKKYAMRHESVEPSDMPGKAIWRL